MVYLRRSPHPASDRSGRCRSVLAAFPIAALSLALLSSLAAPCAAQEARPESAQAESPTAALSVSLSEAPLLEQMPAGAIAWVEIHDLAPTITRIERSARLAELKQHPAFQQLMQRQKVAQALVGVRLAEAFLERDLWTAARTLLGGQLSVALYPVEGAPPVAALAVLQAGDREALQSGFSKFEPFLLRGPDGAEVHESLEGVETFVLNKNVFLARGADWVAASNHRPTLRRYLEHLAAEEPSENVLTPRPFQQMRSQMGTEHTALAAVNLDALRAAQGWKVPERLDNAVGSLLFAGILEMARHSPYLGVTLDLDDGLRLRGGLAGTVQELDPRYASFFSDPATPGTPALPELPSLLGGIAVHRDFGHWYQAREELMSADVLPEFDKFEAGIANLLPGRNFSADVLPVLGRNLMFVAAPQSFDHLDGRPGVQLPGFALVIEMARPDEASDLLSLFFQTLSGVLNIQAGQQGRQPWVLASESYNGVQLTFGRYLEKPTGDRLSLVHNFMPASAQVGNYYVISSSRSFCRELVDALQAPSDRPQPNRNFNFELRPQRLAGLLEANQDFFTAQAIKEGRTLERSQQDLALAQFALKSIELLRLSTHVLPETFEVEIEVQLP